MRPLVAVVGSLVLAVLALAVPAGAGAAPCGLPDAAPLWIDYTDYTTPGWRVLAQSRVIAAATGVDLSSRLRAAGAQTVYWDMYLKKRVGTPSAPADPGGVVAAANRLFDYAVASSGCATPLIAENELFGAQLSTPWSATNAVYRSNVLTFLETLAARGARPFLLLSQPPAPGAAVWWQQVARSADLVVEVYPSSARVAQEGPVLGSRDLRSVIRRAVNAVTALGVPGSRIGIMGEFESGKSGRDGLPTPAWLEFVKLEALAARQVAAEDGLGSIWSWGWGTFSASGDDPDKPAALCTWLWARDQSLCDAPTAGGAGFDPSLSLGQITALPAGLQCLVQSSPMTAHDVAALTAVTGSPATAEGLLLTHIQLASAPLPPLDPTVVAHAEQTVIANRFRGDLGLYAAALERSHLSEPIAQVLLADELRARQLAATTPAPAAPSAAAVRAWIAANGDAVVREVAASEPQSWLGGLPHGFALDRTTPAQIFSLAPGQPTPVQSIDGDVTVTALAPARPLSSLALADAATVATTALTAEARSAAFATWLAARNTAVLADTVCLGDWLPATTPDALRWAPYLALS